MHENVTDEHISLMTELGSCCGLDRYVVTDKSDPSFVLVGKTFWFSRLKAKVEGQGEGTRLMKRLVEILDEQGITVVNALNPYGSMGMSALTEFYKKYGFREVEKGLMIRNPKKKHTIHELEAILKEDECPIEILPNGEVRAVSEGTDGGFISVSLALWMFKQIEKETDLTEVKSAKNSRMIGAKLIDRLDKIDTLCEEFRERIEGESKMLKEVVEGLT